MEKDSDKEDASVMVDERLPSPIKGLPARALNRARRTLAYTTEHWVRSLACVVVFLVLALVVNLTAAFFLTFALVMLLMGLDSRISIVMFIVTLAACAILLVINRSDDAGQVAVRAFYFLAIGVIVQLVSYSRERLAFGRLDGETDKT